MLRRLALALVSLLPAAGCARCAPSTVSTDAGPAPAPIMPREPLPPPAPWVFARERLTFDVALPQRCRQRGPLVRASVAKSTRILVDPRSLGALAIADAAERPPRLTGAAALTLAPEGESHDPRPLPWFSPATAPRLARLRDGSWVAGFDQPGAEGMSRVGLFRGGTAEPLGEGDAFEASDIACVPAAAGERCALLTSRIGKVAPAGALVWAGAPTEGAARWKQAEILPAQTLPEARPFGLGAVTAAEGSTLGVTATAVLADKDTAFFVRVGEGDPREVARLPAEHGLIDAAALPAPVAMTYATPLGEDGCAQGSIDGGGAGIRFERPGLPPAEVRTPAPPWSGAIRPLAQGGLAVWVAPLGCNRPRQVVYAVVLDAQGSPVSAPMAVADAASFAVAAAGEDVDLFLREDARVTWVRMTCSP